MVVVCRDTDVLLLLLYHLGEMDIEVWMSSGTARQRKNYPIHLIAKKLSPLVKANILGFHAVTGCDTTYFFSGYSKKSCCKLYVQFPELLNNVGRIASVDLAGLEEFNVCCLYGGGTEDVDELRFYQFSKSRKGLELLSPPKDALQLHVARANFQAKIWLQEGVQEMEIESAMETGGWAVGPSGLEIVWTRLPPVPKACIELTSFGCKTKCSTARCKCYRANQICMYECQCNAMDCANPVALESTLDDQYD